MSRDTTVTCDVQGAGCYRKMDKVKGWLEVLPLDGFDTVYVCPYCAQSNLSDIMTREKEK